MCGLFGPSHFERLARRSDDDAQVVRSPESEPGRGGRKGFCKRAQCGGGCRSNAGFEYYGTAAAGFLCLLPVATGWQTCVPETFGIAAGVGKSAVPGLKRLEIVQRH